MQGLTAVAIVLFATLALAHMQLHYPPPFNASNNPHRTTPADPYLQFPYDCCGPNARWEYPCRGYLSLLDTSDGAPTAVWEAGSRVGWNISGIGNHYGGSCQIGFSVDKGKTFRVATSYEGNCPHRDGGNGAQGQNFHFTVPHDLKAGVQIFAWMWYNREQEFNMNCAAVSITGSDGARSHSQSRTARNPSKTCKTPTRSTTASEGSVPVFAFEPKPVPSHKTMQSSASASARIMLFHERPIMFVADDGNRCETPKETAELKYPDPGPDVVRGDGAYPLEHPTGACHQVENRIQVRSSAFP
jgi:hypothetical protein